MNHPSLHPDHRFISQKHVQPILTYPRRLTGVVRVLSLLGESPPVVHLTLLDRLAQMGTRKWHHAQGVRPKHDPRPCRYCDADFSPTSGNAVDCVKCRRAVYRKVRLLRIPGPRYAAWSFARGDAATRAATAKRKRAIVARAHSPVSP